MRGCCLLFISLLLTSIGRAQTYSFVLEHDKAPLFITQNNDTSALAFLGGLRSTTFNNMDLNLDGIQDLILFEPTVGKTTTLIGKTDGHNKYFEYAPDYEGILPQFIHWVLALDYNYDGKIDIFTGNGSSGVKVYMNTSDENNLRFKLINNELNYIDKNSVLEYKIGVPSSDIPAIIDIDGDGDLDIFSFEQGGANVYFHRNMSSEKYGHSDSLIFEIETHCFGMFAEVATSNLITFISSCLLDQSKKEAKHVGSNMLMIDYEGDGDYDMLLSDVETPGVFLLVNGKNPNSNKPYYKDTIINVIKSYPHSDKAINVVDFPGMSLADVDFDGVKDLLVSPNTLGSSIIHPNICLYKNKGSNKEPDFKYVQNDFLQDIGIDIGDNSYPALADIDNDGDLDLFVSGELPSDGEIFEEGYYYVQFFENVGDSKNPIFKLVNKDWLNLSKEKLYAIALDFADINGDNLIDLIIGNSQGQVLYYENTGTKTNAIFSKNTKLLSNIDVGAYASPCAFDLNKDGLIDLLIGNEDGFIQYWEQQNGKFNKVNDSLGGVNVSLKGQDGIKFSGFSVPKVTYLNNNKTPDLIVSSLSGKLNYFPDISIEREVFEQEYNLLFNKSLQRYSDGYISEWLSIAIADINGDSIPDVFLGNKLGGLFFYNGARRIKTSLNKIKLANFNVFPNPSNGSLKFDFEADDQPFNAKIFNMQGQCLLNIDNLNKDQNYLINHLANGMYFVQIIKNGLPVAVKQFTILKN